MYRVGIIGSTGIGQRHAAGIAGIDTQAQVVAVCDLAPAALDNFQSKCAERWPALATYTDHRQMLAAEQLDIVTVATSDHAHAQLVVDAAEAGAKGIFCEKPLATTVADAARMVAACEQAGCKLSVDHTRRWLPLWNHAKDLIDAGEIGPVQYIVGSVRGPRAMMFRNGTHALDSICWLAGEAQPAWVMADLETGFEDWTEYKGDGGRDPASEPGAYGMIKFTNGVRAFYAGGSKMTPGPKFSTEIIGTTGRLLITGNDEATLFRGEQAESLTVEPWPVSGIEAGVQDLVGAVEEDRLPTSDGRSGQKVVEILLGFLDSQALGNKSVAIPAQR
jgi:predicted dehydrogenase